MDNAAAAGDEATINHAHPGAPPERSTSIRAAARAAAVTAHALLSSPPSSRAPARIIAGSRRRRTPMSSCVKLQIICWRSAGKTWAYISHWLDSEPGQSTLENVWHSRDALPARVGTGLSLDLLTTKSSASRRKYSRLEACCHAVRSRGRMRVPLSLAILRTKALQITSSLGVSNFSASI